MTPPSQRNPGYTLVEILGAFFIMTIILTLVTGIFVENGRQRAASLAMMNEGLSAAATLEQLSSDLEGALHLQAQSGLPDENPWRFQGEGNGELGARSLRFMTQNAPIANRPEHASSWIEVAYFLNETAEGGKELWRWISPRPPAEPSLRFPAAGEEGTMRLAVDVDDMGFRFRDLDAEWVDDWDSAYQPPESPLPRAVEVNLRLLRTARAGETEDESNQVPARLHTRRVVLAMEPIDLVALIELGSGQEDEVACFTVADCLAEGDPGWYEDELEDECGGDAELCERLSNSTETCWSTIVTTYPAIAALAPDSCEP